MKKLLLTICTLMAASLLSAVAEVKVVDNNTVAGGRANVLIERSGNADEQVMNIVVYSYNVNSENPAINEKIIRLSPRDNNITTIVQIPKDAEFVVIKSHTEGPGFAKDETCPVVIVNRDGATLKNSCYFKSLYDISGLKQADDAPINFSLALQDLRNELKTYPDNTLAVLSLVSLQYDMKEIAKDSVFKIAEQYRKKIDNMSDLETQMLLKIYSSVGYADIADTLSDKLAGKNPSGSVAEQKFIEILNKKDGTEFINLSNMFTRQFPNSEYISEIKSKSVAICMKNELYEEAESMMKKENFNPPTQALYLAFVYLEKQNNRQKAEKLFGDIVSGLKYLLTAKTDSSMTDYEWNAVVSSDLAETYRAMGEFYLQLKEKDSSIRYFKLAKSTYKTIPPKIYENLTQAYYIFRMDKEAFAESKEAILSSFSSVKILDINEKLFPKQKIKMKYQDYIDSLNAIATADRQVKILQKMTSKTIDFRTLNTIDDLAIDLKVFNGDVLVIDLFATWCQPCESGLSSLVNISKTKYLSDKISFFAVDCLENGGTDKTSFKDEDFGRVTILFDKENLFSRSIGVKGLPTRLFFDRNGNLCYVIRGASGQSEDIRETEDVISILLKK